MSKRNFLYHPETLGATSFEPVDRGILLRFYREDGQLMPKKEEVLNRLAARVRWQALVDKGWLKEAEKQDQLEPKPEPAPEPEPESLHM